jgi:hypothetical protein
MKTVADFKRKMIVGVKVNSKLYWLKDGNWQQVNEWANRECTISQSNSFALTVPNKKESSWCDWPKKDEFFVIDSNTVEIISFGSKLVYTFI